MPSILDKLFLLYLYIYIVCNRLEFGDISIQKALFVCTCVGGYLYLISQRIKIEAEFFAYCVVAHVLILILASIGLVKGNAFENVMQFVYPVQFLLITPVLIVLFRKYGPQRYIRHLALASSLLAVYVCCVSVLCQYFGRRDLGDLIMMTPALGTSISYPDGDPRVSVATGGFLAVALGFMYYFITKRRSLWSILAFITVGCALYFSKTLSILCAGIIGVCMIGATTKERRILGWIVITLMFGLQLHFWDAFWSYDISLQKTESITQKKRQNELAFAIFANKPFTGEGLGFVYNDVVFDAVSGGEGLYLESSYAMLLGSGGLVGVLGYGFIYLYYPIKVLRRRSRSGYVRMFFIAVVVVMVASVGQVYIWTGGIGLLCVSCLAAAWYARDESVASVSKSRKLADESRSHRLKLEFH